MTLVEGLHATIEANRAHLKDHSGGFVSGSANGPIGINLIDALVVVTEDEQERIEALENKEPKPL